MRSAILLSTLTLLGASLAKNDCSWEKGHKYSADDAYAILRAHVESPGSHNQPAGTSYWFRLGSAQVRTRSCGTHSTTTVPSCI